MKQFVMAFLLIFATTLVGAKDNDVKTTDTENTATLIFTGSVADIASGESLVGVEVKLEGTDLKTYTDFDGNFSFRNVKPGEYKLVANYISYEKNIETLQISGNEKEVKIKLQSSN